MQGEIVQELHSDWLRRVHYFAVDVDGNEWEVDDEFKLQLSLSMSVEVVAPMETVFKEDSPSTSSSSFSRAWSDARTRPERAASFGEDVLVYYSRVLDEQEFPMRYGGCAAPTVVGTGPPQTVLLLAFPGDAIHELLDRPGYEYVKHQVRRKMFVWQVRHVMLDVPRAEEAVAADTYADGMQVLLQQYGFEMMQNVPTINERHMIMREAKGDDEVKVMRLFRKMWNRKRFIAERRAWYASADASAHSSKFETSSEPTCSSPSAPVVRQRLPRRAYHPNSGTSARWSWSRAASPWCSPSAWPRRRILPEPDVSYIGADGVAVD